MEILFAKNPIWLFVIIESQTWPQFTGPCDPCNFCVENICIVIFATCKQAFEIDIFWVSVLVRIFFHINRWIPYGQYKHENNANKYGGSDFYRLQNVWGIVGYKMLWTPKIPEQA